jgi:ribosome-associated protein
MSQNHIDFELRGDHITLDALLKATGLVGSGGAAKMLIADGQVRVNGEIDTRRGRKLRSGDRVVLGEVSVRVSGPASADPPAEGAAAEH